MDMLFVLMRLPLGEMLTFPVVMETPVVVNRQRLVAKELFLEAKCLCFAAGLVFLLDLMNAGGEDALSGFFASEDGEGGTSVTTIDDGLT